jgi:RNA polymerase sigma-70 factor, ECF subfamily
MSDPDLNAIASDGSLIRQFRKGEDDAATRLYLRYAERLRSLTEAKASGDLAGRFDADDVVQSVFRTFFRRVSAGEYDVSPGEELWRLILVIGLNKVRALATHHKAAKRDVRTTEGVASAPEIEAANCDDVRVLELTIEELLAGMPPVYRDVVTMRIAGFEVSEIATKTGRAKRSIERILQEFRGKLDRILHES